MSAEHQQNRGADRLRFFAERVQSHFFSHFPIVAGDDGRFAGLFLKYRLDTVFSRPASGVWLAETVFSAPTGQRVGEETVIALCRASQTAVVLDRFARSLHLLNLLGKTHRGDTAFLPVSLALLDGVSHDHGAVFREIVDRLELPCRIGILLPAVLETDPDRLARIGASYRDHGFAIALAGEAGPALDRLQAA